MANEGRTEERADLLFVFIGQPQIPEASHLVQDLVHDDLPLLVMGEGLVHFDGL